MGFQRRIRDAGRRVFERNGERSGDGYGRVAVGQGEFRGYGIGVRLRNSVEFDKGHGVVIFLSGGRRNAVVSGRAGGLRDRRQSVIAP